MINYHSFFFFLGTLRGNLLRNFIELILFLLITYMIVSEYTREKKRELKYLTVAFGLLALQRLVTSSILANILFGDLTIGDVISFLPVIENVLEAIALIMLANEFLYPIFIKKSNLRTLIKAKVIIVLFLGVLVQIFWFLNVVEGNIDWETYFGNLLFIIIDISLLSYPLVLIRRFKNIRIRYRNSLRIAFLLYLVTPFIRLVNVIFYDGLNARLGILENPFPVLSVLMFTRIVYLKLVDKAYLKSKLEESERLYEQEKQLSKLKDEFISTVSHELRTPLTSIKLYNSMLNSGKFGIITKKQKEALEIIRGETDRLAHLIDDILNLSKLESKKVKINKFWFNINEVVRNKVYYSAAEKKMIDVIINVPNDMKIFADKEKFTQVFVNLMDNAIKYTNKKGKVYVIGSDKRKESILRIKDTGIGIEEDEIPKLFDKFYRIEDYMTSARQGAGLGLAIVKKLVELHNGKIEVKSRVGKGSVFTVVLPKS